MNKQPESIKIELENCTFVKTLLMIIVIFYHSIVFWRGDWFVVNKPVFQSDLISTIATWLNSFHIYGFAMCSGYIFSFSMCEKKKYKNYQEFIFLKMRRLLIPYCFACIVWVIPITQYFFKSDAITFFKSFVLAMSPSQLWFLWMLFIVFVIAWPLSNVLQKNDLLAIIIGILSFGIGIVGGLVFPNIFCIWTAFSYLPFFILGMKLREKTEWFIRKISLTVFIVLDLILFFLYIYLSNQLGTIMKVMTLAEGFILHIVGALMVFFAFQKLAIFFSGWKKNKIFKFISKRTMPVYLFHQ